jgi:hypothetical protein
VTCLIAALVGLIGYTVGASDQEEAAAEAAPSTPELIPLTDAYRSGRSEGYRRGRLRAYREGRFDGLEEGRRAERRRLQRRYELIRRRAAVEALDGVEPGAWFLVAAAPDARDLDEVLRLAPGVSYQLCRDGSAVCTSTRPSR